ncbi:hypothetical protein Tco_1168782 [Tanacetum coccineum]
MLLSEDEDVGRKSTSSSEYTNVAFQVLIMTLLLRQTETLDDEFIGHTPQILTPCYTTPPPITNCLHGLFTTASDSFSTTYPDNYHTQVSPPLTLPVYFSFTKPPLYSLHTRAGYTSIGYPPSGDTTTYLTLLTLSPPLAYSLTDRRGKQDPEVTLHALGKRFSVSLLIRVHEFSSTSSLAASTSSSSLSLSNSSSDSRNA